MDVEVVMARLAQFAEEREWGQFHTPKNLVMALSGEVGELTALFQWLTPEESAEIMATAQAGEVRDELADVAIYLLRLVDVLGVDLGAAVEAKIAKNAQRYSVAVARGNAIKQ